MITSQNLSPHPSESANPLAPKPKAVVVLSGGQDSATCLFLAQRECEVVGAIHFQYGQKHEVEGRFAAQIASLANVPLFVTGVPSLADFADSALVTGGDVSESHPKLSHLPASFVPGRNLVFLTLAAAFAMKQGATHVYTGVCQEDYAGYPDCRESAIYPLAAALRAGMDFPDLELVTPLMNLSKAETWALASELGVTQTIIEHTHTCYNGEREVKHIWGYGCGFCPACETRAKGYREWIYNEAEKRARKVTNAVFLGVDEAKAWRISKEESLESELEPQIDAMLSQRYAKAVGDELREQNASAPDNPDSLLPQSGPLPRPQSLDAAANSLRNERVDAPNVKQVTLECSEFTSVCPRTGQPDFGTVEISYRPRHHLLESKSLKFYLWAFRDEGMFCEALAARIAGDVMAAVEPYSCFVTVTQNARGGIGLEARAERYGDAGTGRSETSE